MKKIIWLILLLLVCFSVSAAYVEVIGNGGANNLEIEDSSGVHTAAQSFSLVCPDAAATCRIPSMNITMNKLNAPTGNIMVNISLNNSGVPGNVLYSTNVTRSVTSLTTSYASYDFNFTDAVVSTNTQYWIVIGLSTTQPASNYARVRRNSASDEYVKGESKGLNGAGTWSASNYDLDINISYEETTAAPNVTFTKIFNAEEIEAGYSNLSLNVSYDDEVFDVNASLIYNGTMYSASKASGSNVTFFNASILLPLMSNGTVVNFVWNVSVGYSNGSVELVNQTDSQTIVEMRVSNCTSGYTTLRALNMTVTDEETGLSVNADMVSNWTVWRYSQNWNRTYFLNWVGNSTPQLCIYPSIAEFFASSELFYSASGYPQRRYSFVNASLSGEGQSLSLFLLNDSSASLVTMTVTDENGDEVPGAFIHVLGFDVDSGSYVTVEILETDFQGQAFAELILDDQWYQFKVFYAGDLKLTTSATKVLETSVNFQINLGPVVLENYLLADAVTCSIGFNNLTKNFGLNFSNPTGEEVTGRLLVRKITGYSESVINQTNVSAASGSLLVGIDDANATYVGIGTVFIGDEGFACGDTVSVAFGGFWQQNSDGVLYAILLILVFVGVGLWSPIAAIILCIFALIGSVLLGLIFLSWSSIITLVIIGGILIFKIKK